MIKKTFNAILYILYLLIIIIFCDAIVLNRILGFGPNRDWEQENINRYPTPYVAFSGKPNVSSHNEMGFRGKSPAEINKEEVVIAFFGGSTGYNGKPSIPEIVEEKLEKILLRKVSVLNFSVVSSNHRQHLHGIIEYLPKINPDLVLFYGGWNETVQSDITDPRPGYPYNHFYRGETNLFIKILFKYSAVIGGIDEIFGVLSGLH